MTDKAVIMGNMRKRPANILRWPAVIIISLVILSAQGMNLRAQNSERELFLVAQKAFEDGFYDIAMRYINQLFAEYPQTEKRIQANLLLGQCYFFKSQYLKAYDIFQDLLKYNEFKDASLFWLGETYLKGSDYKSAEKQYLQLINLYPNSIYVPQAQYSIGWCYFEQGNYAKAKNAFLKLIRTFPVHQLTEDASFKLAETEYHLGAYENTIEYFKAYILKFPKSRRHAQAYFYIGESYYYLADYLSAVTYYAKTAEIAYENKLILMSKVSLGWSYLKLERFKMAQQYFEEAYQFATDKNILSDDVLLGQATFYAEINEPRKALEAYQKLIEKFPSSDRIIEAHLGLANTHYQIKEYALAIKAYQTVITKCSGGSTCRDTLEKSYFGLAWAFLKAGDIDEAIKNFQTIKDKTESKTVKISALTQIGDAYQDAGQHAKAIDVYDQILQRFPDSPYADYVQYRQGIALLKMEKVEAATLSFQGLQANFPTSKYLNDVNYYLAVAYFKKKDWVTAKEHIVDFISTLPHNKEFLAEAHYILGLSRFNLKEYQEAAAIFNKILTEYPNEPALVKNADLYLAKCQYQKGDTAIAIEKFKTLVVKHPKSDVAQEALLWLGDHFLESSEFNKAVAYYQQFTIEFPGSEKLNLVQYELGRAYQADGKYDKAISAFKQVSGGQDPDLYAKAKLAIADIFAQDLDQDSAVEMYQNIIRMSPEFKRDAYIKIARIYVNGKNYGPAIQSYAQAIKSDRESSEHGNAELQFSIADTYELINQRNQAVEEYLKIPYLYQNDIAWILKAYLRIARIFEDEDKWNEAKITYEKIIKFDTDESKFAQERLDWIREHVQR